MRTIASSRRSSDSTNSQSPWPRSASLRRKPAFTARSMPTVKNRGRLLPRPSQGPQDRVLAADLAVREQHQDRLGVAVPGRAAPAACSAGPISVPPRALIVPSHSSIRHRSRSLPATNPPGGVRRSLDRVECQDRELVLIQQRVDHPPQRPPGRHHLPALMLPDRSSTNTIRRGAGATPWPAGGTNVSAKVPGLSLAAAGRPATSQSMPEPQETAR